jgi:long-chain acyl-CoA synthetase
LSKRYANLVDLLEDSFARYESLSAFTCLGHSLTYGEMDRLSAKFASFLQAHTQLKPGDRIAIQLPNLHQYPIALYGALRAGMVVVNTNPLYTPTELRHQLIDSGAKGLVVLANVACKAAEILADTSVETVVVTQVGDMLPAFKRMLTNGVVKYVKKMVPKYTFAHSINFLDALAIGKTEFKPVEITSNTLALLQYTGGTTGVAKGAMLSHGNICANIHQILTQMKGLFVAPAQIAVAALPLYHIYAFNMHAFLSLTRGAQGILIPNPRDIKSLVNAVKPYKISVYVAVNTLYNAMVRNSEFGRLDFSGLTLCSAGGMAVTEEVAKRWHELTGCLICEGYGLTETSPVLTSNPDSDIRNGTIGVPLEDTELKIVDEQGHEVAEGEPGELCARGPQVMSGYWQRPEATAEVLTPDGWFSTGDIAVRRPDGYYKIVDRKKDMILVSGFKVYPNEVEDVVTQHPDIIEAAAIGVPNDQTGEAVKLFVVSGERRVPEDEIIAFCRKKLTGYKIPKLIEYRDSLPKSNVGKILRRELRS